VDRDLKIGVVDSLTNGQFARDIAESGYADRVAEVSSRIEETEGGESSAASMAELAARETGFGLAMVGPFDDNTTYMAVHGPGDSRLIKKSRNFQDSDHIRRWLTTQGLDWVRRVLLGQLTSPADFN